MLSDRIIELADGTKFYIISECSIDGRRYIMSSLVDMKRDEIETDNLAVQEILAENGGIITKNIEDNVLAAKVTQELIKNLNK